MVEQVGVAVIGAGQAGLAISYYLTQQARSHVVLEKDRQVGSAWRHGRWDSFTLLTPNWTVRLPGFPYRGDDPDGFMTRAEVVSHLEQYAASFGPPVRFGVTVTSVDSAPGGGYFMSTAAGDTFAAANVVVATGSFQFPRPTKLAYAFPLHIAQLHSSHYRNPDGLPPGAVLVVGSSNSGCQIVEELFESGRQVYLCVGRARRVPRRYRAKDSVFWGVTMGLVDQTADQLPDPSARFAAQGQSTGKNGGHTLSLHHFARSGVVLLGRLTDVHCDSIELAPDLRDNLAFADKASDDFKNNVDAFVRKTGMDVPANQPDPIDEVRSDAGENAPTTVDLKAAGVTSVIWANGYGFDYSWVHLPVLDSFGYPIQRRGVTRFPGLYFLGMDWLYSRKSGILFGVGEDAAHVAADIASTNPLTT
jgi:putative flavoprotein involved in K+ transport